MARLFLDANVLFAAALSPHGACRALARAAHAGVCEALSSPFVIDEASRNIRTKYAQHGDALVRVLAGVRTGREADATLLAWANTVVAAKDAPILAAAIANEADALVTGDRRHFGRLLDADTEARGVRVISPRRAATWVLLDDHES